MYYAYSVHSKMSIFIKNLCTMICTSFKIIWLCYLYNFCNSFLPTVASIKLLNKSCGTNINPHQLFKSYFPLEKFDPWKFWPLEIFDPWKFGPWKIWRLEKYIPDCQKVLPVWRVRLQIHRILGGWLGHRDEDIWTRGSILQRCTPVWRDPWIFHWIVP